MLSVSMKVERNIDGQWYMAEILRIDSSEGVITVKYIDDDNVEDMVPSTEVRIPFRDSVSPKIERRNTLPKPLAGLMDDDYDTRFNHMPKTVIHNNDDDADGTESKAVIINGSPHRLAAGGGVRALRYLRK